MKKIFSISLVYTLFFSLNYSLGVAEDMDIDSLNNAFHHLGIAPVVQIHNVQEAYQTANELFLVSTNLQAVGVQNHLIVVPVIVHFRNFLSSIQAPMFGNLRAMCKQHLRELNALLEPQEIAGYAHGYLQPQQLDFGQVADQYAIADEIQPA